MQLFPGIARSRILFTPNFAFREEYQRAIQEQIQVTLDSLYPLQFWPEIFSGHKIILRFDPGQGYGHHQYVCTGGTDSKFGIPLSELNELLKLIAEHQIQVMGFHCSCRQWDITRTNLERKFRHTCAAITEISGYPNC